MVLKALDALRISEDSGDWSICDPLMSIYQEEVDLTNEARRERAWEEHFSTYGSGVSMFRTKKTTDLVLEGIPGKLRNQVRI